MFRNILQLSVDDIHFSIPHENHELISSDAVDISAFEMAL